jgi:riboflavin-specific deaminase-like protein
VLAKTAVSADGFVGRRDRRVPLSDPAADRWLHRQRAAVDALAVGAGTVLVDDPRLTPRGAFRWRPLTRVVCDWRWRVRPTARVFSTTGAGPVIMVGLDAALRTNVAHRRALEAAGAEILALPSRDLGLVLDELGRREVQWLLVEGGPELHEAFFAAGLVDRAQRIASPVALGDGVPQAPAFARLATCARPDAELRLGADVLTEWDVHRAH